MTTSEANISRDDIRLLWGQYEGASEGADEAESRQQFLAERLRENGVDVTDPPEWLLDQRPEVIELPGAWMKMTPQGYAHRYLGFGDHVAVSQQTVKGVWDVWVFLGKSIEFKEVEDTGG